MSADDLRYDNNNNEEATSGAVVSHLRLAGVLLLIVTVLVYSLLVLFATKYPRHTMQDKPLSDSQSVDSMLRASTMAIPSSEHDWQPRHSVRALSKAPRAVRSTIDKQEDAVTRRLIIDEEVGLDSLVVVRANSWPGNERRI